MSDNYTITAVLTDDDGESSDQASSSVTVNNVAPAINGLGLSAPTIPENGTAVLVGLVTDPGTLDTFTLEVDWGDPLSPNNTETYEFPASSTGSQSFALTHRYLDDHAVNTPQDSYAISVTVMDDDQHSTSLERTVTVANTPPVPSIAGPDSGLEAQPISLTASATDRADANDTISLAWTVTVNGTVYAAGTGGDISFTPDDDGVYIAEVTATDEDGGESIIQHSVDIANVAPTIDLSAKSFVEAGSSHYLTLGPITDPGDDTVTEWIVDWGDGTPPDTFTSDGVKRHTYVEGPAKRTISVHLVDEDGTHSDAGTINVDVLEHAKTAVGLYNPYASWDTTGQTPHFLLYWDNERLDDYVAIRFPNYIPQYFRPVIGDWFGTGEDTVGLYNPYASWDASGQAPHFYLYPDIDKPDQSVGIRLPYYIPEYFVPLIGDWFDTGEDSVGFFNPYASLDSSGQAKHFYLLRDLDTPHDYVSVRFPAYIPAYLRPVAGDWFGTGEDTVGLYNPYASWDGSGQAKHFYLLRANDTPNQWVGVRYLNNVPDYAVPIVGDWFRAGEDKVGFYNPAGAAGALAAVRYFTLSRTNDTPDDYGSVQFPTAIPTYFLPVVWEPRPRGTGVLGVFHDATDLATVTVAISPMDTDQDGSVTPLDALRIVNFINRGGSTSVESGAAGESVGPPPMNLDVNRDGQITPLDVLPVVNYLNGAPSEEAVAALPRVESSWSAEAALRPDVSWSGGDQRSATHEPIVTEPAAQRTPMLNPAEEAAALLTPASSNGLPTPFTGLTAHDAALASFETVSDEDDLGDVLQHLAEDSPSDRLRLS